MSVINGVWFMTIISVAIAMEVLMILSLHGAKLL